MVIVTGILTLVVATAISFLCTPLAIRLASAVGAVDHPGPRKIHRHPIPRAGGIPVLAGFAGGLVTAAFASGYLPVGLNPRLGYWFTMGAAATAVFLLGLADDIIGVSFRYKFLFQVIATVAVWIGGFRIEVLSHPLGSHVVNLGMLSLPVTLLWVVGVTNAMNLIDGLDGLAAGTGLITTLAVAAAAYHAGQPGLEAASVALVGSLLGFLRYNFHPARIFLGDSGAMFLGFVLAVASIHGSQKGPTAIAIMGPLLVLGFPILDTGLAILRRLYRVGTEGAHSSQGFRYVLRNAHRVFLPDRGHLHHRLLDLGMGQRGAVIMLYVVVAFFAVAALAIVVLNKTWLALVVLGVLIVAAFPTVLLIKSQLRRARERHATSSLDARSGLGPVGARGVAQHR